jgi:hypothetical protein
MLMALDVLYGLSWYSHGRGWCYDGIEIPRWNGRQKLRLLFRPIFVGYHSLNSPMPLGSVHAFKHSQHTNGHQGLQEGIGGEDTEYNHTVQNTH